MILHVLYQGRPFGRLADTEVKGRTCVFFEYAPEFLPSRLELSPMHLPLGPGLKSREESAPCEQLPGLFEDSLPDTWGQSIMFDWFQKRGVPSHQVTALMQLSYVGDRGMGALTYKPEHGPETTGALDLERIQADAYAAQENATFSDLIAELGSAAGGAQPKALIGINDENGDQRYWTGTRTLPPGYDAWLVKFTGRRAEHPGADGRVEYAYSRMAAAAGIDMPPTRLIRAGRRQHFAVKRFDREGGERLHHHTLARLTQIPGGDLDYATFLRVTAALTRDHREVVKAYRRAVFNVLARNDDDHGRNHGFLLRKSEWSLSPAYDVTFRRLRERGLAVCGERRSVGLENLRTLASRSDVSATVASEIIEQVQGALAKWDKFAEEAEVPASMAAAVRR